MRAFVLSEEQAVRLRVELKQSHRSKVYRRAAGLLAASQGTAVSSIASLLGVTRQTVYNWIASYSEDKNLNDAPRSGRPSLMTEEIDASIVNALATTPETFGYSSSRWSASILRTHVGSLLPHEISDETLRRRLRRIGYSWKGGRYVLQAAANMTTEFDSCPQERAESVLSKTEQVYS
jgi:transposase